jgi:hypothetical protein
MESRLARAVRRLIHARRATLLSASSSSSSDSCVADLRVVVESCGADHGMLLERVLQSPDIREQFGRHAQERCAAELLRFWVDAEALRAAERPRVLHSARQIYRRYVDPGTAAWPLSVGLDTGECDALLAALTKNDVPSVVCAVMRLQDCVFAAMRDDVVPHFARSVLFMPTVGEEENKF